MKKAFVRQVSCLLPHLPHCITGKSLAFPPVKAPGQYSFHTVIYAAFFAKIIQSVKKAAANKLPAAAIFLEQQARGAHNIDLVTPTHYVPQIIKALTLARQNGLSLPVVYNSNAYETIETITALKQHVDIFLPDLKYYDNTYAVRYSAAPDYFAYASQAITKMVDLAGPPVFDAAGIMQKGVIVRHLAVPGLMADSRNVLSWLWQTFGNTIFISLMNQYTPLYHASNHPEINRRLTTWEYNKLIDYALSLGIENCFIQKGKTASADYVPVFDGSGI
ncbi:radical SAM protein [Sporomusa sp.]|uniref:radical SAM protein n=1 Tax=Sporomusa sp. TaxID=2078658 RepID=UPI002C73B949|nr:radical SAM protein [Sporomusa sp.]HWR45681.1 radical SAM protein [Sporomusa sp.]